MKRTYSAVVYCLVIACFLSCNNGKRYHDSPASTPHVTAPARGMAAVRAFQEKINAEFRDPDTSPLPNGERGAFKGLAFFEADTSYQVWARLVRTPEALPFDMPTTTARMTRERQYGTLYFELKGQPFSLQVYQNVDLMQQEGLEDYLFLPFTDETNGTETYTGGRYIDLAIPQSDSIFLDFNTAYNPSCAYNPKYSCPIVPEVNHLDAEIRAGVMKYAK